MKKITKKQLAEILKKHRLWLVDDENGERADLSGANNVPFIPYACTDVGSFIGYKKASGHIVELKILQL